MASSYPVTSVEDIIATFGLRNNEFTPISGEPTLTNLLRIHSEARDAALRITHCLQERRYGYLYLVEDDQICQSYGAAPYVPPVDPGDMPNLLGLSAFGNEAEQTKVIFYKQKQIFDMHKNVNDALVVCFRKAIKKEYIEDVEGLKRQIAADSDFARNMFLIG